MVDDPGFWPWQDLYADALIALGRAEAADAFLAPHAAAAQARGLRSAIGRFARIRGRIEAARGDAATAAGAFESASRSSPPSACRSSARSPSWRLR